MIKRVLKYFKMYFLYNAGDQSVRSVGMAICLNIVPGNVMHRTTSSFPDTGKQRQNQ